MIISPHAGILLFSHLENSINANYTFICAGAGMDDDARFEIAVVDDEEWVRRGLISKLAKSGLPVGDNKKSPRQSRGVFLRLLFANQSNKLG
jgi:hypothetical protein